MAETNPMQQNQPDQPQPKRKFSYVWIYLVIIFVVIAAPYFFGTSVSATDITWQELKTKLLDQHAIDRIEVINAQQADIYLKERLRNDPRFSEAFKKFGQALTAGPQYRMQIGSVEVFENKLNEAERNVPDKEKTLVVYRTTTNSAWNFVSWIIPFVILFLLWQYFLRKASGGGLLSGGSSIFNFGKSPAKLLEKENKSSLTFDDVAGLEEAKLEVKEIVDFLKAPEAYTKLGAKIPKGIIIVGPPGTGKTLLAKAVAGEAQVPFFSISGSEFVEMFVGVGASRVRDLFSRAKEKSPCIIFIDEIDAVGRSRAKNAIFTGSNDERESTLNQLLTEMDGFDTNSGVIVLAATNRADMLDPALLRPGRFDRHIYLELPNVTERKAIFRVHLRPLVLDASIDVDYLAAQTPGFSGADIANICNEAALIAARKKHISVNREDFTNAIDRIVAGLEKKSKIISPEEKRIIAYHEAGHAVISWLLEHVDPLSKVSIIPRGKSLGAAWYLPEERQLKTETEFVERLCAALAGRAAEEVVFNEVSSGALDDLEKVTKEAYTMVAYFGFNKKIGNISFYDSSGEASGFQKPYSEETAKLIDEEVRKLVADAYERAKHILTQNRRSLVKTAELLLQKETIYKEDLETILGARQKHKETETAIALQ